MSIDSQYRLFYDLLGGTYERRFDDAIAEPVITFFRLRGHDARRRLHGPTSRLGDPARVIDLWGILAWHGTARYRILMPAAIWVRTESSATSSVPY